MNTFKWVSLFGLLILWCSPATAETDPPKIGGVLPEIILKAPKDTGARDYLGLKEDGTFQIPQIQARMVIIEIFSMY